MSFVEHYTRAIVASENDRRTSRLLQRYTNGPTRLGIQTAGVTVLPWSATIFAFAVNTPGRALVSDLCLSTLTGVMMAGFTGVVACMGKVTWNWCHLRLAIRRGKAVVIHPLVMKLWREEVKRTGVALSDEEFAREMGARFALIKTELNDLAADATHPQAKKEIKASLRERLRTTLREEASALPATYAQRDLDAAHEKEALNAGIRARYQLPPDGESAGSIEG